jgi:chemotaxis protein methyltransferase CheR
MSAVTIPAEAIAFVCTLVRQQSAIELDAAKAYLIEARLAPVAKRHGFSSTNELIGDMRKSVNRTVQQQVVEALTTNETSFYRDIHPFDALKGTIIPSILRTRAAQRTLNIWSAACSTGQEAYSVAMLLRDNFPELNNWKVNILGTDLSEEVLAKARAGRFSQIEMNRGLPATLLAKHFSREGMNWEISPQIRGMATFTKLNLIERWPQLPVMDVVFLRNVLIYFSPATKKAILEKIRAVMAPHAVLFLGAAETTMNLDSEFIRVQVENQVFYTRK